MTCFLKVRVTSKHYFQGSGAEAMSSSQVDDGGKFYNMIPPIATKVQIVCLHYHLQTFSAPNALDALYLNLLNELSTNFTLPTSFPSATESIGLTAQSKVVSAGEDNPRV